MARGGKFDFKEVKELQKQIERLEKERDAFCEECARYLAARLLAKVIKRTPSNTGTLRRGWTTQSSGSGAEGLKTRGAAQYADTLKVYHFGNAYVVEIINPVEYASYVEFGHRTANHKGWVKGNFMLTISERELQTQAPKMIEKKLADWLKGVFHV